MALLSGRHVCAVVVAALLGAPTSARGATGESAAALEWALATAGAPYLVIDLGARTIDVALRGRAVERVRIDRFTVLRAASLGETPPPLEVPAVWRVAVRPPSGRRLVLPEGLVAEDVPASASAVAEAPPPPESYFVATVEGWRIEVDGRSRGRLEEGRWRRLLADGWRHLRGGERPPRPDRLRLEMAPEAAARLHHLFRPGVGLLVTSRPLGDNVGADP